MLLTLLSALLTSGCQEASEPGPDIQPTIDAAVQATIGAQQPTPTPTHQFGSSEVIAMVKDYLNNKTNTYARPTPTARPTINPTLTPTPTKIPTPTLEKILQEMDQTFYNPPAGPRIIDVECRAYLRN